MTFMPHSTSTPSTPLSLRLKDSASPVLHHPPTHILVKNRRNRYLDLHPEYLQDPSHELADPLLYDRLIRRFQSASEREQEGRSRGYTGNLEADLMRSEAKLEALRHPDPNTAIAYQRQNDGSITALEADADERVHTREEGRARWEKVIRQRFLRGEDGDFEYDSIDNNEDYDDRGEEERIQLEQYLAKQDEEFVGDGKPEGQTGVQDF